MLVIYNTLSKQKEEFIPLEKGKIKMYVCGPTVYDLFHIGNARSFINSDFIRKYLEYKGYEVSFAMNLTDVDDKIINKANAENKTPREVAEFFTRAFFDDIVKLGVKPATIYPKATEHIGDIISMIERLIQNGYAYNQDGNVFFDISKFKNYGKLSGKNIDDLIEGARVEINTAKQNPLDFALWKSAKPGEPAWESPWSTGRPGWHIECSAMSCKHLGDTFDIHAGGNDLIFPHHENEIAQSEAANGKTFVRYWLHFGFLNINNEKMSKSLGNFQTARDFLVHYSAETIRFFFAQTHYGAPLNFANEGLESAKRGLQKIDNLIQRITNSLESAVDVPDSLSAFDIAQFRTAFESAMDDDFNTPRACGVLFDFIRDANKALDAYPAAPRQLLIAIKEFLDITAAGIFGIASFEQANTNAPSLENELIELLISVRVEAKKQKQYQLSDFVRDELAKLGIVLQDGKDKTTFKKLS